MRNLKSVLLCLPLLAAPLYAQYDGTLPSATVGVPYSAESGIAQYLDSFVSEFSSMTEDGVTFQFQYSFSSLDAPPGLTVTSGGVIQGTPTAGGTFTFNLNLTYSFSESYMGQTYSYTSPSIPLPETIQIAGSAAGGKPSADPGSLVFSFTQGSTTAQSQSINIKNPSSTARTFTASFQPTSAGASGITVTGGGSIPTFGSGAVTVTVDPSSLMAGVYAGKVLISLSSGETFTTTILVTVTSNQASILLSQTGFQFQAVQGGGAPASQALAVLTTGKQSLNYSAAVSTSAGGNWLSVTPSAGSTPSTLAVNVDPSKLNPGTYYGQVTITATGAVNSPQTASVVLNVYTPAQSPGASLSTTGLIFVAALNGSAPKSQNIVVTNPSPTALTFSINVSPQATPSMFSVTPTSGSVVAGQPVSLTVTANPTGLKAGVYQGELDILFQENQQLRRVSLILVVLPAGAIPSFSARDRAAEVPAATVAGCTPSTLYPVFTQLGGGFSVAAGWPVPLEVTVVDDCGSRLTSGSVSATFSSGDPALSLTSLQDGRWTATWQPRSTQTSQVTITSKAVELTPALAGSTQIGGGLKANPSVPSIAAGGALSAASYALNAPLAPGAAVAVFGSSLATGTFTSPTLPLSQQLGGTQVLLGGRVLPLEVTTQGQINAIVPYDVPINSVQQLIVMQNSAISVPEPVTIAAAQPAVFTINQAGTGAAIVVAVKADGTQTQVDATHPASAGDALVIYCTGLGAVSPSVAAGTAAPLTTLSNTVNPVTVTIGGQTATPFFAGLAPGFTGLYQVNVYVPAGLPSGDNTLTLTVAGQTSPPVTVNLK